MEVVVKEYKVFMKIRRKIQEYNFSRNTYLSIKNKSKCLKKSVQKEVQ